MVGNKKNRIITELDRFFQWFRKSNDDVKSLGFPKKLKEYADILKRRVS